MTTFLSTLDPTDPLPLYRQLYGLLRRSIADGRPKAGERLPSKRWLAADLKVSLNTVEAAYDQLVSEGFIRSAPRSGFFVCSTDEGLPRAEPPLRSLAPVPEVAGDFEGFTGETSSSVRFDFRTNTVDTALFPFSTWSRISREVTQPENRHLLEAGHPQGDSCLRESVARYLRDFRGVECDPAQILIGAGTEYLLGLLVRILGPQATYALENPGYPRTLRILQSCHSQVRLIGMDPDGMRVGPLEESGADVAYLTPSHHFPLGTVMPAARRMQLLRWAAGGVDRWIVEDDYDSEFRFVGRPIPSLQGTDREGRVVYLGTFSKSLAPSMRISYMVLPRRLLERYRAGFTFYSSTVSRFDQNILHRFIRDGHFEKHLNRMRRVYRARKDAFVDALKRLPFSDRIEILGENAGPHLLLRFAGGTTERELVKDAEQVGVRVYGLSEFYLEPVADMPQNTVVMGYAGFSTERIAEAVRRLGEAWETLLPESLGNGGPRN